MKSYDRKSCLQTVIYLRGIDAPAGSNQLRVLRHLTVTVGDFGSARVLISPKLKRSRGVTLESR